jgi:hypothetical protein
MHVAVRAIPRPICMKFAGKLYGAVDVESRFQTPPLQLRCWCIDMVCRQCMYYVDDLLPYHRLNYAATAIYRNTIRI